MITVTSVLLDEFERDTLHRVAHLVPLAYPASTEPPHLRPQAGTVVDERDPRLRIIKTLAEHRQEPVFSSRAHLALEVLTRLDEVVRAQASRGFWLGHIKAVRRPTGEERAMAEAMVAERGVQVLRVRAALALMAEVTGRLTCRDDPAYWARAEDGDIESV